MELIRTNFLKMVLVLLFTLVLVSCAGLENAVTIQNDANTTQTIHFNCLPRRTSQCPNEIPKGDQGVFRNVNSITIVHQGEIFIIKFKKKGRFRLRTSEILSANANTNLHGQCKTLEIKKTQQILNCSDKDKSSMNQQAQF